LSSEEVVLEAALAVVVEAAVQRLSELEVAARAEPEVRFLLLHMNSPLFLVPRIR
jgi:hypothetical protein